MPAELIVDPDITFDAEFEEVVVSAYAAAAKRIAVEKSAVCIRLCSRATSQNLNATYRQRDQPTNVLSFPAELELPDAGHILGDIALCWPLVITEAQAQNKSIAAHASHLAVHGLLHLAGYDHEADSDALAMERLECEVLAGLGIADPYR